MLYEFFPKIATFAVKTCDVSQKASLVILA